MIFAQLPIKECLEVLVLAGTVGYTVTSTIRRVLVSEFSSVFITKLEHAQSEQRVIEEIAGIRQEIHEHTKDDSANFGAIRKSQDDIKSDITEMTGHVGELRGAFAAVRHS